MVLAGICEGACETASCACTASRHPSMAGGASAGGTRAAESAAALCVQHVLYGRIRTSQRQSFGICCETMLEWLKLSPGCHQAVCRVEPPGIQIVCTSVSDQMLRDAAGQTM